VSEPSLSHSAFAGFRFPPEIIVLAVRWYLRFGLSYRDVEELLSERGVEVDHVTVYLRVQRLALQLTQRRLPFGLVMCANRTRPVDSGPHESPI
jgi:transposase-like protein